MEPRHSGHVFTGPIPAASMAVAARGRSRSETLRARIALDRGSLIPLYFVSWGAVFGGIGIFMIAAIVKAFRYW